MKNVTEYLKREYDSTIVLYKNLSKIKTLSCNEKKNTLKLIEEQIEVIDSLDRELGTNDEERKLAFIVRTLVAARRLCLE